MIDMFCFYINVMRILKYIQVWLFKMLFSSYEFILIFLPLSLAMFHLVRCYIGGRVAMAVIVGCSLFFYGWWNPPYLLLIVGSIGINFLIARRLIVQPSNGLVTLAVGLNIAAIGYFKYRNFFLENLELVSGQAYILSDIFIPLGISFFTFQQIALLLDANDGTLDRPPSFLEYSFFILFFPQLIAGPIVLYRELSKQYSALQNGNFAGFDYFGKGVLVFALGLFKKTALADPLGHEVDLAFSSVAHLSLLEAWYGAVAFLLQIFLDFSGYADMAIGLGLMFGFILPANFHHPYRSTSMIEFWKRWHITMTRFFMMYLYAPLALSMARWSMTRSRSNIIHFVMASSIPLMVTFLISGLWHGASWTFVVFGAVNGIGLFINHVWKEVGAVKIPRVMGWLLTMVLVTISLIYFRASSVVEANALIATMFNPSAFALPTWMSGIGAALNIPVQDLHLFPFGTPALSNIILVLLSAILVAIMPDLTQRVEPLPSGWGAAFISASLLVVGVAFAGSTTSFIYFQF